MDREKTEATTSPAPTEGIQGCRSFRRSGWMSCSTNHSFLRLLSLASDLPVETDQPPRSSPLLVSGPTVLPPLISFHRICSPPHPTDKPLNEFSFCLLSTSSSLSPDPKHFSPASVCPAAVITEKRSGAYRRSTISMEGRHGRKSTRRSGPPRMLGTQGFHRS